MRTALALLLFFVGISCPAHAQERSTLDQAADDFWKGRYSRAAQGYEKALAQHPSSPDLWFNLGTSNAFRGERGLAAYALEQTLIMDPDNQDARYNLGRIRQQVIDDALGRGTEGQLVLPGDDDLGTGLLTAVRPNTMALLFATSWCALFIFLWFGRQRTGQTGGAAHIFLAVMTGLMAMASGGMILGRALTVDQNTYGVVVNERAAARRGPAERYPLVAKVAAGVKVQLTARDGDWQQVNLPNGAGVWLPLRTIRTLTKP